MRNERTKAEQYRMMLGGIRPFVLDILTKGLPEEKPDELADHFAISAPFIAEAAKRAVARKRGLQ